MKKLLLGNEAVARGLYEAGVTVASSYPGTPSTEITENAAKYEEIYAEWAPNEKVAAETAIGASIGGARSFCAMKHVGLNVAADPLFIMSYIGVNGGMLVAVADDPGMHSSQNEQDSRHYARAAKLPMLEPSDSTECKEFARVAYDLSEKYDTAFMLRLCTRISHSQSIVELGERVSVPLKPYTKDAGKYVMMPAYAKRRHVEVEKRLLLLNELSESDMFNKIEDNKSELGIITSGTCYRYAKEIMGDKASYLKLGMVNPLPANKLAAFAATVKRVVVIEELDGFIEGFCKSIGIKCEGKELFPVIGELSQEIVREKLVGEKLSSVSIPQTLPPRPPVLCPGCPHRGLFYVLKKLGLTVIGDIGCYTLGAVAPLDSMDTTLCMGASISGLHGFNKARGAEGASKSVALIGDSTFMHSGLTGIVNMVYNKGVSTVVISDNSITGMTGHQQNPCTGLTLQNEPTTAVSIEGVCAAIGVKRIAIVDPNETALLEKTIKEELAAAEPSVIIARRPCVLLKYVKRGLPYHIDTEKCKGCRKCMSIGCPAISFAGGKATIDKFVCTGCGLCRNLCAFGAISVSADKA